MQTQKTSVYGKCGGDKAHFDETEMIPYASCTALCHINLIYEPHFSGSEKVFKSKKCACPCHIQFVLF